MDYQRGCFSGTEGSAGHDLEDLQWLPVRMGAGIADSADRPAVKRTAEFVDLLRCEESDPSAVRHGGGESGVPR